MTMVLLIILIAVPLLEIAVMIKVGQAIGFWPTFGIVIGTFVLGASILARSGLAMAFRVQEAMVKHEPPAAAMMDGALLALAGVLLATPGFVADMLGLALLIPPLRGLAARWVVHLLFGYIEMDVHVSRNGFERQDDVFDSPGHDRQKPDNGGPVIEGEFERLDERPIDGSDKNRRRRPPPPQ